ncbi:hypothetical protein [Candidatus Stoquefichus sp. SB1]|uniref:hypothetical protein n=1 Tax=Candidatus Stoquefichus sp. SB1 TaxID=1658109 RepID=UPI0018E2C48C|nr:hypothetical protein [Candidatus Stoquefichus sp. SB1]
MNEIIDTIIGSLVTIIVFLCICYYAEYTNVKRNEKNRLTKKLYRVDLIIDSLIEKQSDRAKKVVVAASWIIIAIIIGVMIIYG